MKMDCNPFVYSTLKDDKNIRLLRLLPNTNPSDRIEGHLSEYSLSQVRQQTQLYEAISYTWGEPKKSHSIWIDSNELSITANCHAALLQLRDCYIERILWVDAICIDQSSKEERGKQVQLMAEVYCKARQVIVWLGESTPETDDAIERIRAAAQRDGVSSGQDSPIPSSIGCLLERPWFRRVWVLQEVAAAQHIVILCGSSQIDGYAFCLGLPSYIDASESFGVISSVENLMRGSIFRPKYTTTASGSVTLGIRPLGELMDMYHAHDATEPLDKVFAMLGMSTDGSSIPELTPDYSISWEVLFGQLIAFLLGPEVKAETSNSNKIAVISGKGVVIGKITSVIPRSNKDRDFGVDMEFMEPFRSLWPSRTLNLHAGVKGVQQDDILCFLDGATSPMLIRHRESYFSVIMITVSSLQPQPDISQISTSRNFVLTGDLDEMEMNTQAEKIATWTDDSIIACIEEDAPDPVKRGHLLRHAGQILADTGQFIAAVKPFQKALDLYSTILAEDNEARVACSAEMGWAYSCLEEWDKAKDLFAFAVRKAYAAGYDFGTLFNYLDNLIFVVNQGGTQFEQNKWQMVKKVFKSSEEKIALSKECILYTVERLDSETLDILIDQEEDQKLTGNEKILTAAVRNESHGGEVTKVLLERLRNDIRITEGIFVAATANDSCAQELTELLLQQESQDAQITQSVLRSAASNFKKNKTLIPSLLAHHGIEVDLDRVANDAWEHLYLFIDMEARYNGKDTEKNYEIMDTESKKHRQSEMEADYYLWTLLGHFLKNNQVKAFRTIISATIPTVLFRARRMLYRVAWDEKNWDRLDEFIELFPPSLEDIISTLTYVLMSDDKQEAKRLLHIAQRDNVGQGDDATTMTEEVVSGCCRLIQKQSPTELSCFLDYVSHLGNLVTRRHRLDALPTQSAILPAAVSSDQRFMEILIERNIVTARMRPFTIRSIWEVEGEDGDQYKIKHETFPPDGMPDWPLYCAIVFTFDPKSIAFLCRAGARIDSSASNEAESQSEPEIILKLQKESALDEARRDFVNLKEMCNTMANIGVNPRFQEFTNRGSGEYYQYYYDGIVWDQSFIQAWKSMDSVVGWDWHGDELFRWEGTGKWPEALRSEEAWDSWRLEVLDILRPFVEYHY